ncbi:MAG: amidohydrolase [Actinomycetia bacterium]|nr:amidohydrolase [Actinomycetes bacterium]
MHDLVIRSGTVVDGTGGPSRRADVAVEGGRIVAVGRDVGPATRTVDAEGCLVTPGWVDPHTHYDAQVTWDPEVSPSGWHGVTTAVIGNCGVGFAPVRPDGRGALISLMEGVEDIPGPVLEAGLRWDWETFPEYLDALDRMPRTVDIAAQVPHAAVRVYVMGARAVEGAATADDIVGMAALVRDGVRAGAVGFTTSRTPVHRSADGNPVPGTTATAQELLGIGVALRDAGTGVVGVATGFADEDAELGWMTRLSRESGRPVTFAVVQGNDDTEGWRRQLAAATAANAGGGRLVPQVAGRPTGVLMGLESTAHPFFRNRAYGEIAQLPLSERVQRMRDPDVRRRILDEPPPPRGFANLYATAFQRLFPLGDPPEYEPPADRSVAALAARAGEAANAVAYDLLLGNGGRDLLYFPLLGYADGDLDAIGSMLADPVALLGLGDGGAHCGLVCDASQPTFMLTHWARDRTRGARMTVERVVRMLTADPARLFGFDDRGVVAPGRRADLNVIDFDALQLRPPEMVHDLPSGGRRLVQRAVGYRATILAGEVTYVDGVATGARPGRLVRSARSSS